MLVYQFHDEIRRSENRKYISIYFDESLKNIIGASLLRKIKIPSRFQNVRIVRGRSETMLLSFLHLFQVLVQDGTWKMLLSLITCTETKHGPAARIMIF